MGRGVRSSGEIEADSEVLVVPNKLILSQDNLLASVDPLHVEIAKLASSGEQSVIGALLLEKMRGKESFFYEYIQVLPEHVPNLSYFSGKSLESLQSPSLAYEVQREQRQAQSDFSALTKAVRKIWPGGRKALPSWEDYQWAKSIIDSRGLRFSGVVHLAPYADMFNYAPHPNPRLAQDGNFFLTHHKLDAEAGVLRILADRSASEGEQLLEDYGDNRDKIYLQYHGFVSEANPFRCVELRLPNMRDEEALPAATRNLLSELRFQGTPQNCVERNGFLEKPLLVFLFAIAMTPAEVARCSQVIQSSKGDSQPWTTVTQGCGFATLFKELETAVHKSPEALAAVPAAASAGKPFLALVQQVRERIAATVEAYPSTLENDEAVLADWEGGAVGVDGHGNVDREEQNSLTALRYRIYAKRHLLHLSQLYGPGSRVPAETAEYDAAAGPAVAEVEVEVELDGVGAAQAAESAAAAATSVSAAGSAATPVPVAAADAEDAKELREGEMPINTSINEADLSLEQQLERFNSWFNAASPMVNKLAARYIPGWRIGTVATADIADKEYYLGVPKSVVMDSTASRKHPVLKDLYRRLSEVFGLDASDDFHELLFLLIYEQHVAGKDSFYWPYLSLLPTPLDQVIVPTLWTHEEMLLRLAPSHILNNLIEYQSQRAKTYQGLTGILPVKSFFIELDAKLAREAGKPEKDQSKNDNFESELLNWDTYVWAQAILDSRSIWWEGKRHLVPMLDFINCIEGPDPSRVHSTAMDDTNTNALTRASWAFASGEQVFENYGQANYIYFMYHGFALPIGQNYHDCIQHTIKLTEEEIKRIDFTDQLAQNIAKQVGFNRSPSTSVCMSVDGAVGEKNHRTGLPQDVWLAMSLKLNNFKSLREQKLLGLPNLSAMQLLLAQLEARLVAYTAHFAKGDPHKSSTFFLRTEEHHLLGVLRYLKKEIAALGGDASTKDSSEEL